MRNTILIASSVFDTSTDEVIHWLVFRGHKVIRLNKGDSLTLSYCNLSIENKDSTLELTDRENSLDLSEIKSFWYRRGGIFFSDIKLDTKLMSDYNRQRIDKFVSGERRVLQDFFYYKIYKNQEINTLGNPKFAKNNKLIHLEMARAVGFETPKTVIVSSKEEAKSFIKKNSQGVITKAISDSFNLQTNNNVNYVSYTSDVRLDEINKSNDTFFPSLLQMKIGKKFEIRSFFLKGKLYSMAIFSQRDRQTATDFRQYNYQKPNRTIPFNLPINIKNKIKLFMELAELDTGSIDLIYTPTGEYVFLEVNPVGQFGMVSYPCNYLLEKSIAETLSID